MFAEFLLSLLAFPLKTHQCRVNGLVLEIFLGLGLYYPVPSFIGTVKFRRWVRSDVHLCRGEGQNLLLLILAESLPWGHGMA